MSYMAYVKRVDSIIEEEVELEINGICFTGFSILCRYDIEKGKTYPVNLYSTILDDVDISELSEETKALEKLEDGYEYILKGILTEEGIDVGVLIEDDTDYILDYSHLIGKYVQLKVDRIGVGFLENEESNK